MNNHNQKGFTAAAMVVSMFIGTGLSTIVLDQVAHNKAGVLTKYINAEKYGTSNLYSLSQDHPVRFQAVVAKCQTPAGIQDVGRVACENVHYVNAQLLGNY
ncbi:hypothetical protein HF563_00295 [Acidithiobacillus ferridurans]|nr:hypothetical protein [Acidithiobacillus ferridurans]